MTAGEYGDYRRIVRDSLASVPSLAPEWRAAFADAYAQLAPHAPKILLATYFDAVEDIAVCAQWPVAGWHIDLVRAPDARRHAICGPCRRRWLCCRRSRRR